jgi:hypothetical protein
MGMLSDLRMTFCGLAIVVLGTLPVMFSADLRLGYVLLASWFVGGTIALLGLLAMAERLRALARRQRTAPPSA